MWDKQPRGVFQFPSTPSTLTQTRSDSTRRPCSEGSLCNFIWEAVQSDRPMQGQRICAPKGQLRPKSGRLSPVLFPNGLMNIESPVYEVSTE